MHACNPSTLGGRGMGISVFEAILVYRVSSRTARATQRNPVSEKNSWEGEGHIKWNTWRRGDGKGKCIYMSP